MSTINWTETRFLKVPLTSEESQARGEQLADILKQQQDLEVEQTAAKKRMKDEASEVQGQVNQLAKIVRERVEERSMTVELRLNTTLNLLEEVRVDTGEVTAQRSPTLEDKLRAQMHAQTEIPGTEATPPSEETSL